MLSSQSGSETEIAWFVSAGTLEPSGIWLGASVAYGEMVLAMILLEI